jgi:hypothetical protein
MPGEVENAWFCCKEVKNVLENEPSIKDKNLYWP